MLISDPLVHVSPAWTEQRPTVLMVLPSFIISGVPHPRVSKSSPLIRVQPLWTGPGLAHESNITLKRDASRLADVAARQLSLFNARDNSSASICLPSFIPNESGVMTRAQDSMIEIDDPLYHPRFRMCAHVHVRSQRAEGTHCDPGCIWPPESMLAAAEMMIKELGVGLENVD